MPSVVLGNVAPVRTYYKDDKAAAEGRMSREAVDIDEAETSFSVPAGDGLGEALTTVTRTWDVQHSDEPPAWVESDSAALAELLADHWDIPVGRPKDWAGLGSPKKEGSK